ncbi:GntR family transcriptional regulator [Saccharothrix violaceirubra]|uniref:DNA-binding transcriptional regulator YhcF (GntR family) n=1 Tax=Saccharothrix violaceirubra TaxID=413306 RepID=A0A7W7WWN8_9PSEU|nr:GntR family transcriptional regulator [Saccharothrix violaceirubra]MBB4966545.1 DNA-binding transcriptional regulator YhcF (GntR family) [Saccharothrix violaceirubra]
MLITIDPTANVPLADQIAASVRGAAVRGELSPGDRLPPAREVAAALGVNLHTVLRGYQRLRDEGLVDLRRGRAAVLTDAADGPRLAVAEHVRALVEAARRAGLGEQELHTAIEDAFNRP